MTDTSYLPFSRPTLGEDEIAAVADVLRSGWITTGRHCLQLEEDCAALVGARSAVALSSATAGMHLVLMALGIGPGDEVVTPSMTWVSTVNLITLLGATPVFADVERDTLMVTRDTVEPLVTERTRAILPVHYAGMPLDLDPLRALAAERGVALVEDAAHAIGTHHRQSPVGSSGTAIFSLHPIKNVTTGEGGIVVSDDQGLVERLRRLRFHGLGVDAYDREVQGRSPQSEVLEPGYKYNLPDMNAVVGVVQLRRLEDFIRRRGELAALYAEELATVEAILPLAPPPVPGRHAWHLYIVRLDTERAGLSREDLMAALGERGIGTGIHFKAAHLHRFYRERPESRRASLPETEWNSSRLLSLPLFPTMAASDVRRVTGALREILG